MFWVGAILLTVLICLAPFWLLYMRRRWLSRRGGVFDCALKMGRRNADIWSLGIGRYEGERFEWYRSLSLFLSPTVTLDRLETRSKGIRIPDKMESLLLFTSSKIIKLEDTKTNKTVEVSMSVDSATGMLSWLESSPPKTETSWRKI